MKRITVLNVNGYISRHTDRGQRWEWIADSADERLDWEFVSMSDYPWLLPVRKPCLSRYFTAFRAAWKGRNVDVIVAHGEKISIWTGFFLRFFRHQPKFISWGFNAPTYESYSPSRKMLLRFGLQQVDRFIVFSKMEKQLYHHGLGLPAERFDMIHWSVAKPVFNQDSLPLDESEYIAAIGGEGRDYASLFRAMASLKTIKLIVVGSSESLEGLAPPSNVEAFTDIPYEEAINIAHHAMFLVLPLESKETPCGHGSLITQFNLGKATVISESEAMSGYAFPEKNVLTYPPGDSDALAKQILTLYEDASLRDRIATAGAEFAEEYCSEEFTVNYFNRYIRQHFFAEEAANDNANQN